MGELQGDLAVAGPPHLLHLIEVTVLRGGGNGCPPGELQLNDVAPGDGGVEIAWFQFDPQGMGDVPAAGHDVGASPHGVQFVGAEGAQVMLLERPFDGGARVAHLCGADQADVILGLLAPEHQRAHGPPVGPGHIADLERAGHDLITIEHEQRLHRLGADQVVVTHRQQRPQPQTPAAAVLGEQEILQVVGQEVLDAAHLAQVHVTAEPHRLGEQCPR